MIITEAPTVNDLTLNTLYLVKWAVLQRLPDNIKVTGVTSGTATIQYYDAGGVNVIQTVTAPATTAVWIIDLTK